MQLALEQRIDCKIHIHRLAEQSPGAIAETDKFESDKVFLMVDNKRSCTAKAGLTDMKYIQTHHLPDGFAKMAFGHEQRPLQGDIQKRAWMALPGNAQRTLGMKRETSKAAAF